MRGSRVREKRGTTGRREAHEVIEEKEREYIRRENKNKDER